MTRGAANAAANDGGVLADDGTGGVTRYRQLASVPASSRNERLPPARPASAWA